MAVLVVVGILNAVSSAAQGWLADACGSSLAAALINFVIGTGCLLGLVVVLAAATHGSVAVGPAPIWAYAGGFLGATGLTVSSTVVSSLGVLRLSLCRITGQLAGSLALDAVLPFAGHSIESTQIIAVAFVGLATLVASRGDERLAIAPSADALESTGEAGQPSRGTREIGGRSGRADRDAAGRRACRSESTRASP